MSDIKSRIAMNAVNVTRVANVYFFTLANGQVLRVEVQP